MEEIQQKEIDQKYHAAFKDGLLAYKQGDYKKSAESFRYIVENYPDNTDGYINLGNALYRLHDSDGASQAWEKAKSLDSYVINSYINLGNLYYKQRRVDEAIKEWESALLINPINSTVIINLASTYEKIGKKKKAFNYYEFFIKNAADNTSVDYRNILKKISQHKLEALEYMKKGVVYQKKEYYRNAVQDYLKSIEVYPNFAKGFLNLGNVCYLTKRYQQAVDYWLESYKNDRSQVNLCLNLAVNYEKLKLFVEAYCFYERFVRKAGKNSVDAINAKRRLKKLDEIIHSKPKLVINYREESEELLKDEKYEAAVIRFENLYLLTKDEDVFEKLNEIKMKTDPLLKAAEFAFESGKKYKEEGNIEKSLNAFKKCKQFWPDSYFAEEATMLIAECGRIMGGAISAVIKAGN